MAIFRILSGCIEISAAFLMLKLNQVEKAIIVNSLLATIGPIILIITMTIGLVGIAGKISFSKFIWIVIGVICILYGVRS